MKVESLGIGSSASYLPWVLLAWSLIRLIFHPAIRMKSINQIAAIFVVIGQALAKGQLRGIYIPPIHQEADRTLIRQRKKIWRDLVHCNNRVKCFLDYNSVNLPENFDNSNWSRNFITWLLSLAFAAISNDIRKLMRSAAYKKLYYLLRSVPGIGPLTAASLLTEIGAMRRFQNFYHLNSIIRLKPIEHSFGEKKVRFNLTV